MTKSEMVERLRKLPKIKVDELASVLGYRFATRKAETIAIFELRFDRGEAERIERGLAWIEGR